MSNVMTLTDMRAFESGCNGENCQNPDCHGPRYLHPRCHMGGGLAVHFEPGVVLIDCHTCGRAVGRIKVEPVQFATVCHRVRGLEVSYYAGSLSVGCAHCKRRLGVLAVLP